MVKKSYHTKRTQQRRTDDVFVTPQDTYDPLYQTEEEKEAARQASLRRRKARKAARQKKRQAREKKARARRKRRTLIFTILFVFAAWLILRLAPIPFGHLVIDGNQNMSQEDVQRACGAYSYVNVIQLSPDEIEQRLKQDLRIADASAKREFPDTIHVTISERQPAAVITTLYGFAYVDKNGKVIALGPQLKGVALPIMTGKKVDNLLLGDTVSDPTLHAAIIYLQNLSPDLLKNIAEINVGNPESIVAYTNDSLPIHLGKGDEPEERAKLTETLLAQAQDNHLDVQYIDTDVRSPLVKTK